MTAAHLGLGGNLGDPASAMAEALRALDGHPGIRVLAASRLFRTPPWGVTEQPWFVNACARIETDLEPETLLDACLSAERLLKRERRERWGPRTIDIDVLLFGDRREATARIELPHPRLTERAFVLAPLADIAPALLLEGRSVAERAAETSDPAIVPLGEDRDWWKGPA